MLYLLQNFKNSVLIFVQFRANKRFCICEKICTNEVITFNLDLIISRIASKVVKISDCGGFLISRGFFVYFSILVLNVILPGLCLPYISKLVIKSTVKLSKQLLSYFSARFSKNRYAEMNCISVYI